MWAGLTPPQLLDLKRSGGFEAEMLLDRFVSENATPAHGFTNSVVWNCVNVVRSLFMHNYLDLARAAGHVDLVKVKPYRKPKREDLRRIYKAALNPMHRMLIFFACSGIARETLSKITWGHLEPDWEKVDIPHIGIEDRLLKGHGRGKWKGVEQHTFLTPEAKEELLFYREWLCYKRVQIGSKTPIFVSVEAPFEPLTKQGLNSIMNDLQLRSGVKFSLHDGRRYIQTALEEVWINRNWIQKIKGRKVRGEDSPYSQPEIEKLRQKFREAVPILSFLTEESEGTKQEIKDLKEALGDEVVQRQKIESELSRRPTLDPDKVKFIDDFSELLKDPEVSESFKQWLRDLPKRKES